MRDTRKQENKGKEAYYVSLKGFIVVPYSRNPTSTFSQKKVGTVLKHCSSLVSREESGNGA